jgi:5-methylcytosine-specific restriction enzyme A
MPSRIPYYRPAGVPSAAALYQTQGDRRDANRFYSSTVWRRLRASFLAANPLCEDCGAKGLIEPAVHVHHVKERRDHPELELDWDNLQGLCLPCHNAKRKPSPANGSAPSTSS